MSVFFINTFLVVKAPWADFFECMEEQFTKNPFTETLIKKNVQRLRLFSYST